MSPVLTSCDWLAESPEEVARQFRHLQGFVFLDSSDAAMAPGQDRFSLLTACPRHVVKGSLDNLEDRLALRQHWELGRQCGPDWGFPTGGLIGWVDYDGAFVFGEYPSALIFHHHDARWYLAGEPHFLEKIHGPEREPVFDELTFESQMNKESFVRRVRRAQEWIAAGDIYQVNLAHQFRAPCRSNNDAYALYDHLRTISPAPYAAYLHLDGRHVLSSSPECFLKMSGRGIQTRPIKGTRPRFADPQQDEKSAYDLLTSQKEIAELVMITDLERNDLGRLCEYGSVHVSELLALERYAQVFHLVSTVEGRLRDEVDHLEALRVCSPGGSITGAPKKRAMEIIKDLECVPRGLYTGSIGYLGWNGESQFSIAIRTLIHEEGYWHFHVGAGIVADSDPELEYQETLHKAAGILRACEGERAL